jgi:DNA-binding SARP family transcriptional activator/tetratricopeptide (TPR) repeat protein
VELRLLGPVEVWTAGAPVDAGAARQRGVLAALAVDANRPVLMETLIDRVWGEAPPSRVRATVYAYITRIRQLLERADGPVAVSRRSGGYQLDIAPERVDLHRFQSLVEQARRAGGPDRERAGLLGSALALWHGTALAGLSSDWAAQVRHRLVEQRLDTAVEWARIQLREGDPQAVLGPLGELAAEHPVTEPLALVLIEALAKLGHTSEALDHYATLRQRLADELGIDPGPQLQQLHRAVLRGTVTASRPAPARPPPASVVPAQLPPDVSGFTGRHAELAQLDALLATTGAESTTVVITAIAGTAGVGKTALAVHWAHLVADRFPDGQLYVNLRGFDPSGLPTSPAAAIRGFLDALDVPADRVPADLDAQAALYRSRLAGRRCLIVLDNARDPEQVRPLLPGAPGCLALITSRDRLAGLVAAEGAHPLTLHPLTADEAHQLLGRRLGTDRVAAEPDAAGDLVTRTARLPLALTIVAARAATDPHHRLRALADDLRTSGLAALSTEDGAADLRAVFSWSYRALDPPAARLFRLLGVHPGPELTGHAAASLLGVPLAEARKLLAQLARAHLVSESSPGRYTLHDLLRAYALELVGTHESESARHAARRRLLDHYLHTAHAGSLLVSPTRDPIPIPPRQPDVSCEDITDFRQATAWFSTEHRALLAAIAQAAASGFDIHAWQLAWATANVFHVRGLGHDLAATHQIALAATQRLADRTAEAHIHYGLACAYARMTRFEEASAHLRHAIELFQATGKRSDQAQCHLTLGWVLERDRRLPEALAQALLAHDLYQETGNHWGLARSLNNVGWLYALLGEHRRALRHCLKAIAGHRASGDLRGEATALDSLGYTHHHLGDHAEAAGYYWRALHLFGEIGDRFNEAETLVRLGDTHCAAGDPDAAVTAWRYALGIFEELDLPEADGVRRKLGERSPAEVRRIGA